MIFWFLFRITRSGLSCVVIMSGGIVPPFWSSPGRSANISKSSGFSCNTVLDKKFRTELCLQVYLPWCKATGQKFKICCNVPLLLQRGHWETCLLPHLFKLSGVGRQFVTLFNRALYFFRLPGSTKQEIKISCEKLMLSVKRTEFSLRLLANISQNKPNFLWKSGFPGRNSANLPYFIAPCSKPRSFINTGKSKRPNKVPWGPPPGKDFISDTLPLYLTNILLLERNPITILSSQPGTFMSHNLVIRFCLFV